MEGHSVVAPEVVGRYARDAACQVPGVAGVVEGVRKGVRVDGGTIVLHLALAWGVSIPEVGAAVQRGVADYLERMTDVRPAAVDVVVEEIAPGRAVPPPRFAGLTKLTLETAPSPCRGCVWWQTRGDRELDKDRWMEKVELDFGPFGTVYYDGDGRVLGSMQYGPAPLFPRAAKLPGGPAFRRRDARHLRLPERRLEPVGAAVALPGRDRRGPRPRRPRRSRRSPIATPRANRPTSASACTRPSSRPTSSRTSASASSAAAGRVGLARLELGGLVPVLEGSPREGAAGAEGSVPPGPGAGAAAVAAPSRVLASAEAVLAPARLKIGSSVRTVLYLGTDRDRAPATGLRGSPSVGGTGRSWSVRARVSSARS